MISPAGFGCSTALRRSLGVCLLTAAPVLMAGCGRADETAARPEPARRAVQVSGEDQVPQREALPFARVAVIGEGGFAYCNGRQAGIDSIVETLGGGVALLDYDGDRRTDLYFPGGGEFPTDSTIIGRPGLLLRNRGDWRFAPATQAAGIEAARAFTHGTVAGDFDADGFTDLLVTGYGRLQLFRNQGDGTFAECAAAAGLTDRLWSTGAAWGDLDGDGGLDLYVAHYVDWTFANHRPCPGPSPDRPEICGPKHFEPLSDVLYLSNGDGTFREAGAAAGLVPGGKGLGVIIGDVDLDGDSDLYVGNDTTPNFLYRNRGAGVLEEVGQLSGTAFDDAGAATGSMGVALCDYNGDLRPDLFAANYEHETFALYRNEGPGQFFHVSRMAGITAVGSRYVGWGTALADFDLDADEDLIVATGHVMKYPTAAPVRQRPIVLMNEGDGRFENGAFGPESYFAQPHDARGLACGDLDGDGDLDLAVSHNNVPPAVLENRTAGGRWLRLRLTGTRSNRDAIGAYAILHTTEGDQLRLLNGGGSYLSQSDLALHWGLGAGARIDGLTVHWPSGEVQTLGPVQPNQTLRLVERRGTGVSPVR